MSARGAGPPPRTGPGGLAASGGHAALLALLGVLYLLALAAATLTPRPPSGAEALPSCLLCGRYAVADAVLNVILFVPLGVLGAARGGRYALLAVPVAALLTGLIEVAQLHLPGRHASVGDALLNVTGAAVGLALVATLRFLARARRWVRNTAAALLTVLLCGVIWGAGWLLRPVVPAGPYTVLVGTRHGAIAPYPGRVLEAALGPVRLRPGGAAVGYLLPERVRDRQPLAVRLVRDTAARPTHVVGLYAADDEHVLRVLAEGRDVILQQRLRARRARLHEPALRFRDALETVARGDTFAIGTRTAADGACLVVAGRAECGSGVRTGQLWRLLYPLEGAPPGRVALISGAWLFAAAFFLVWLASPGLGVALVVGAGSFSALRQPAETLLRPSGGTELLALALGCAAALLWQRYRTRSRSGENRIRDPA